MNSESNLRSRLLAIGIAVALLASACGSTADELADAAEEVVDEAAEVVEGDEEEVIEDDEAEEADTEAEAEEELEGEEAEAADDTEVDEVDVDSDADEETVEEELDEADEAVVPAEYKAFCERAAEIDVESQNIIDPTEGFELISEAYGDLATLSPDEDLANDLTLMADVSGQFFDILSDPDFDLLDPTNPGVLELEALSTPEVEAAAQNVEETIGSTCASGFLGLDSEETLDETIVLDGPGEFAGSMALGTFDIYELDVPAGTAMTVTIQSAEGNDLDPLLDIVAPDGTSLVNDDFVGAEAAGLSSFDSRIEIAETQGGIYMLEVRSFGGDSQGDFLLTIEFG